MKRTGQLYARIAEPDNLRRAYLTALRGKQQRREVRLFQKDLTLNLELLRRQLLERSVEVGDYRFFTVHDPKLRQICAAAFRERVLHHAIMNVCEPVMERYAIYDSYACRRGKGLHAALARAQQFSRAHGWYLKLDIRKYFDSIPHAGLLDLLARRFKDRDLLELFEKILAVYQLKPGCGLPIGNLLSQHFANFYLGKLDHWLKEERGIKGYLRYMDDFVLFADSAEQLKTELLPLEDCLGRLGLRLKENLQLNRCSQGLPFLGFRIYPHTIRLSPRSRRRFADRLERAEAHFFSEEWTEQKLARHIGPLVEFTRTAQAQGFRRRVIHRKEGVSLQGARTA